MELVIKNDVIEMNDNVQGLIDANIEEAVEFICKAKRVIECGADQKFIREFVRTVRSAEKYTIDLDNVWAWLGYDTKGNCKKALKKLDKDDYKSSKLATGKKGGRVEKIFLTSHAFKQLCLKTQTEQGEKIRNYYIALEEVAMDFIKFKTLNLTNNATEQPIEYLPVMIGSIDDDLSRQIDINDYIKCSCLYLLYLEDNTYKYGITDDIIERISTHKLHFKKFNIIPKIINIWKIPNFTAAKYAETKVKNYVSQMGIGMKKYNVTELFKSEDINDMMQRIEKYITEDNVVDELNKKVAKLELEKESLQKELDLLTQLGLKNMLEENRNLHIQVASLNEKLTMQMKIAQTSFMAFANISGLTIEQPRRNAIMDEQKSTDLSSVFSTYLSQRK